jgi:hypothetical protein
MDLVARRPRKFQEDRGSVDGPTIRNILNILNIECKVLFKDARCQGARAFPPRCPESCLTVTSSSPSYLASSLQTIQTRLKSHVKQPISPSTQPPRQTRHKITQNVRRRTRKLKHNQSRHLRLKRLQPTAATAETRRTARGR